MPFQKSVCYYCKRPGHKISHCWHYKNSQMQQGIKICKYCKKVGHTVDQCFYLKRTRKEKPLAYKWNVQENIENEQKTFKVLNNTS